jgi:PBSX family phage terminase large subunit
METLEFRFSDKHLGYLRNARECMLNVAEGAVRSGKTTDNIFAFADALETSPDFLHLATGVKVGNAKINIGDCDGLGLEHIFRGRCRWGKYKDNDALFIHTPVGQRVVVFAGGGLSNSYRAIRGYSVGMWIATEIDAHDPEFIREVFNRQLAAGKRKVFWDLNPAHPKAKIYTDYIDRYMDTEYPGGYNYAHFTIDDNLVITPERRAEIESQYERGSIWYMQKILGLRTVAEGLIYRTFAVESMEPGNRFEWEGKLRDVEMINVGVDVGGTGSGHAFVATAITRGCRNVIALESQWIDCSKGIDTDALYSLFVDFYARVLDHHGYVTNIYSDSAEQAIRLGLQSVLRKNGHHAKVLNSVKETIGDRITVTNSLMGQGRFYYMRGAQSLVEALRSAVWNPKEVTENKRLDDGTSDIDTLDAFEYTISPFLGRMMRI